MKEDDYIMYLINLSRFVSYKEKKEIFKELKNKNYEVSNDSWSYRRFILNKPIKNKHYIASIIEIKEEFNAKTISEVIEKLQKYKVKDIKPKINHDVPFHARAIKERFLKKNKLDPNGKNIYLEARNNNEKIEVRIGYYFEEKQEENNQSHKNNKQNTNSNSNSNKNINREFRYPDLVLECPFTLGEISDFVRMSKTFKSTVYLITLKNKFSKLAINNFLKENSFHKANIKVISHISDIKKNYDEIIGFSMWGKNTLSDLNKVVYKKSLFVYGNEKKGLQKETMDICSKMIKIGNSSEPLRATQAAAYAFGYLFSKK